MNIAIYTRKSVYIENSESIQTQIEICKNYFRGQNEFEIFEDEGYSGGNTNRPGFQKLMNLCRIGKFDIVAIYKVDRISRNITDFVKIYEELKSLNVKLVSVTEGFDTQTPMGEMMMFILSAFANMERENIKQRVKDNMNALARKGCYTGGFVPFGCTTEKREGKSYLKIVDVELINLMYKKYMEIQSLYGLQKYLEENNLKRPTSKSSLGAILRNPVYCKSSIEVSKYLENKYDVVGEPDGNGYMTYGKTVDTPILIIGGHKGCVEPDLFLKVNLLLDKKKDEATRRESKVYWLTDVLYCPLCGSKYVLCNSSKNTYYVCKNRLNRKSDSMGLDTSKEKCRNRKYVNAVEIEKKVTKLVESLENPDTFKSMYKDNEHTESDNENNIDILEKQIADNRKAIDNLVEKLMLLSNTAAVPITEKIEKLTKENTELEEQIEKQKIDKLENTKKISKEDVMKNIKKFSSIKDNKTKRIAIASIFEKLEYDPFIDSIKITFK